LIKSNQNILFFFAETDMCQSKHKKNSQIRPAIFWSEADISKANDFLLFDNVN